MQRKKEEEEEEEEKERIMRMGVGYFCCVSWGVEKNEEFKKKKRVDVYMYCGVM